MVRSEITTYTDSTAISYSGNSFPYVISLNAFKKRGLSNYIPFVAHQESERERERREKKGREEGRLRYLYYVSLLLTSNYDLFSLCSFIRYT